MQRDVFSFHELLTELLFATQLKGTKKMETLVFGLIVLNNLNNEQELIVPEPTEFRPFDLRTLEDLYNARDNSPSSSSDRKHPYVAQTVS